MSRETTPDLRRLLPIAVLFLAVLLGGCSARSLIVQGVADELASQGQAPEEDLQLAREAGAFYLKLSESLLRDAPGHLKLAEAVAGGFTQYAFAFVASEADRIEARDARAAQRLRERAARLYLRAQGHALAALEHRQPGFLRDLSSPDGSRGPVLARAEVGVAYWGAAAWGGFISLSKDRPDTVADLPLAIRLAQLAYRQDPDHAQGGLASLMGSFELARPGGTTAQALAYFDHAIRLAAGRSAAPLVAKAESIAQPAGDRAGFERLLREAVAASAGQTDLQNAVMRERALWLLATIDDLF